MGIFRDSKIFWDTWEVQVYTLLGIAFQISLVAFGSERKRIPKTWIKVFVWVGYLGAIWAAKSATGNIGSNVVYIEGYASVKGFWPPFFLIILGSPDTITAYAIEDNSLWLRLLLAFLFDVGGAIYVLILTWSNDKITYLATAMYIVGIIKYGERAFVRHKSSFGNLRESLISKPDPFPDLIKIRRKDIEKNDKEIMRDLNQQERSVEQPRNIDIERGELGESDLLFQAFFWFKRFAHLFTGLILDNDEGLLSIKIFEQKKAKDAFNLVAVELGIMYDMLYTKATLVYSRIGILLRCVSVALSVSVLLVFFFIVDLDHYKPSDGDIFITYILLLTNAYVECFGVVLLFDSDWATIIRLTKFNNRTNPRVRCFPKHKRWSGVMGQFNLISSCLKEVSASRIGFHKLYSITNSLKMSQYRTWENVSPHLQEIIFEQLKEKVRVNNLMSHEEFAKIQLRKNILDKRGDCVLQDEKYNVLDDFREFILDVDFDHSLLLWHIATDLCYSFDFSGLQKASKAGEGSSRAEEGAKRAEGASKAEEGAITAEEGSSRTEEGASNAEKGARRAEEGARNAKEALKNCEISKCLADYLLYIIVIRPSMMPRGIGELRFADTFAFAKNVFKSVEDLKSKSKKEVCEMLLEEGHSVRRLAMKQPEGDKHLFSVLKEGIELAQKLLNITAHWSLEKKWRMISEVWVEMLAHVVSNYDWIVDGYQLAEGGELLSHVALLMAHLGLSEQYRKKGRKIID